MEEDWVNSKTSKLLDRFATLTQRKPHSVKLWWREMPRRERESWRKKMTAAVAAGEGEGAGA